MRRREFETTHQVMCPPDKGGLVTWLPGDRAGWQEGDTCVSHKVCTCCVCVNLSPECLCVSTCMRMVVLCAHTGM